jgi:hypothetical protein
VSALFVPGATPAADLAGSLLRVTRLLIERAKSVHDFIEPARLLQLLRHG